MGHHDDQAIARQTLQDLHDLDGGVGIERARRLVCQDDLGIVDDGARDGDTLHLTAGELVGALVHMLSQADLRQSLLGALPAFCLGRTRKQQRHLHVRDDALMGDQVVALEDEAHGMVSIRVPVAIEVAFGRSSVDDEVAAGVLVESADDVEQRGLAAAGLTEDTHEFLVTEGNRYALQRMDDGIA